MKIYQFNCRLLSDVIITSDTATEGIKESLDYIPGSKFLGIVAKQLYDEGNPKKTLDLFHNATVQYSDAYPTINGERSLPSPFSWYYNKGDSILDKMYIHHVLNPEKVSKLTAEGIQLKQQRGGYFCPQSGHFLKDVKQTFSLKSAYDRSKRRSKDSQMFGYSGLSKGSTWSFTISDGTGEYINEITEVLQGRQRIGRSRSAEYGLVEITFDKELHIDLLENDYSESLILFAASHLCVYDHSGQTTGTPDPKRDFHLPSGSQIDWSRSQVRTRNYQTWNGHRHNRDADRLIIEKGSVFFIRLSSSVKLLKAYVVGSHQTEGFGRIHINPPFLSEEWNEQPQTLKKLEPSQIYRSTLHSETPQPSQADQLLLKVLKHGQKATQGQSLIEQLVNQFKKQHKERYEKVSPSQWSGIRNYAKRAANEEALHELLFQKEKDKETGYLAHGKLESLWAEQSRREKLEEFLNEKKDQVNQIQLCIRIASEMAK